MKKIFTLLTLLFLPFLSFSKINWHTDLTTAQAVAASEGKLIVIDFWATWCQPCTHMEADLWNSEEMEELSNRAVFLKLDFDQEKDLVNQYGVTAIPQVSIVNMVGEKLWAKVGYSKKSDYLKLFATMPGEIQSLNELLLPFLSDEKRTAAGYWSVGLEYQNLGKQEKESRWQKILLGESNRYFNKAKKKTEKEERLELELLILLNRAYLGKIKKVKKKLSKMEDSRFSATTTELKNFILGYCYKKEGDEKMLLQIKKSLTTDAYIEELNLME